MEWELIEVSDSDAILDDSGLYVVVNRVEKTEHHKEHSGVRVSVRADLMRTCEAIGGDVPIRSFIGTASNVRKALSRFIDEHFGINHPSLEHMAYIGYELLRAETVANFVQD